MNKININNLYFRRMKKLFLLSSVFAAALLTGCTSDEPNNGENGDATINYLAVNIVSVPDAGTRAAGDQTTGNPSGAKYEEGTDVENKVNKVRFYFFDESGNPSAVKVGATNNYSDWSPVPNDSLMGPSAPNFDQRIKAVLIINTKRGDNLPVQVVAVINPREELDGESYTLSQLRQKTADYASMANDATDPVFPMVTSVYMDAAGNAVRSTKITSAQYAPSEAEALKNPVVMYVERNVAKVRARLNLSNEKTTVGGEELIKLKDKDGKDLVIANNDFTTQVYLKLAGWNVTADPDKANLSKRIDTGWDDPFNNGMPWNYYPYFRSYWAATCVEEFTNQYSNFTSPAKLSFTNGIKYCNENGERNGVNSGKASTKVMFYGTLCDAEGKALNMCEYFGSTFVDDTDYARLKKAILAHVHESGKYYYKKTIVDGQAKYTSIDTGDIIFQTAKAAGKLDADGTESYYVYPLLKSGITGDWVSSTASTAAGIIDSGENANITASNIAEVNAALMGPDELPHRAKIWNTGYTYYYSSIPHYGVNGVVRNHIYEMTINSIAGLGTPVYDPSETIIPEKPKNEDTYIAAQINILSWRVVPSTISLEW